jgi:hypothetical protein
MDRPGVLYAVFNVTDMEIVKGRLGIVYIKPMDAFNEMKRLEYLYPDKKFELLEYKKF